MSDDAISIGGATYTTKTCFEHISKTNNSRDLIFGAVTLQIMGNEMMQSGHQMAPPPLVVPPSLQKFVLAISQRLIKLQTWYLEQLLSGT